MRVIFRGVVGRLQGSRIFAVATVAILALSVGGAIAVFTLADPMLFRPLPYPESEQLVTVRVSGEGTWLGMPQFADFERLAVEHTGLAAVGAFVGAAWGRVDGTEGGVSAYAVTPQLLDVLGVRPVLGRSFLLSEHLPITGTGVALITYGLWQAAFGGSHDVVGRTLDIRGIESGRYEIIGVLPRDFVFPYYVNDQPGALVAGLLDPARIWEPRARINPIARLRVGVSAAAAAAEMQGIIAAVERDYPQFPQGRGVRLAPLQEALFGPVRLPLLLLLAATGSLLVLACANLACLFTARLQARRDELGVRSALGATSWRLSGHVVAELLVVAALGAIAALGAARWMSVVIIGRVPEVGRVYRLLPAEFDLRVAGFAVLLTAVAVAVSGLFPAARAVRGAGDSVRPQGSGTQSARLRGDAFLIFVQTAVCISLLLTGALVVRSFVELAWQPLGYHPERVTAVFLEPRVPPGGELDVDGAIRRQRQVYEELRQRLPVPVAVSSGFPGLVFPGVLGRPETPAGSRRVVAHRVGGNFFEVFGITLESGRLFDDREAFSNAPVAVLDRRAAEALWPGEDSLGRQVRDNEDTLRTVIGVVGEVRSSLTGGDGSGNAFLPFGETPSFLPASFDLAASRWSADDIRNLVRQFDPDTNVNITALRPFERSLEQPRFLATLLGAIGLLTMALTGLGICSVASHAASRRNRELGIRMAFGANRWQIRWLVVRAALVPAALGVATGGVTALWWTKALQSLLHGVQPNDPATLATTALLVLGLVAAASLPPAWRASRLDPMVTLRS